MQATLDLLVQLHDNKTALASIMIEGGLQHEQVAQGAIAGIVRLLMEARDHPQKKRSKEIFEIAKKKEKA